jgi:hypothetical protein
VRSLRAATLAQIEARFADALPQALLAQNSTQAYSRERIFSLYRTVWCWIWQVLQGHTSCREVVRQVQALFALHEAGAVDEATGAYCQARGKLPQPLLATLFAASFASAENAARTLAQPLLGGRTMRVADASGARLCDTPANRAAYPPSSNLPARTGFPFLRIAALFSLASGALLAQATGSLHTSELRLWLELLPALRPGDILLADRAYGLYVVAALLQRTGVDLLASVSAHRHRRIDFRKAKKRLGPRDALFVWKKSFQVSALLDAPNWSALPAELTVRLLRVEVKRRGFRTQHFLIVTTLLDPALYPASEIIAAHARRWRMEMTLDDLKTTLGMEALRCQKPSMVQKELLIFLTAHNLIRWLMAKAASHERKALEQISFKGSLDGFRQWSQAMAQRSGQRQRCTELWWRLLQTMAADALPFRPGRHEPRAVKKRSKYPHLNKPRHLFRGRWSRTKRRRIAHATKRAASHLN